MTDTPRLYLVAPPLNDPLLTPKLQAALDAGDVASLLLRVDTAEPDGALAMVKRVTAQAQAHGVAAILDGPIDLLVEAEADGVEIKGAGGELVAAVNRLSPGHIVGAGALPERHDAMAAGEAGADYVVFGDSDFPLEELLERLRWWSDVFTTPCVALARNLDDVGALVDAGADFIMLSDCVWSDPRGPGAAVKQAIETIVGRK